MDLKEIINSEIERTVLSQINYWKPGLSSNKINKIKNKIKIKDSLINYTSVSKYVYRHEALRSIEGLRFYLDCLDGSCYPERATIHYSEIEKRLKKDPENRVLIFFWLNYFLQYIHTDKNDFEWVFILNDFIEKYPDLINLDDFIEDSFILCLDEAKIKVLPSFFYPVFNKASERYSEKITFQYYLALCHLYEGRREVANNLFMHLHKWIEHNWTDYMEIKADNFEFVHYSRLATALLDDMKTMSDTDGIIRITSLIIGTYYNQFCSKDQEEYVYREIFIELFFRKMEAYLLRGRTDEIYQLYKMILPYLHLEEEAFWKTDYRDVMERIREIISD